jgi:predicted DNA-binding transcriptional regulator YafY
MRLELLNEKRKKDKGKAANVSWLHRACQMKKCVVLHNYHSSNSGDINDRHIEPYKVLPEDNLVLGFDIDKKACRVYNINRIDYVELKENESWGNTSMHLDTEIDAFHLSGNAALNVSLKLDLLARNQLIEEYPRTKDKIVCDARDSNTWYYNDTVRSVLGVARFYMGLAEHITILEAPIELKSKVKELAQEILSKA